MDENVTAMAESIITNVIHDDLESLALIITTSADVDTWRTVLRHEFDIARNVEVGGLLQYDVLVPKLVLWGTETISPHHFAALRGADDAVARFIRQIGVPVDARLQSGATALHLACFGGQLDTVKVLVDECRADIFRRDGYGWTALHYASVGGHFDIVEFLLSKGADVKARDNDGTTAAFRAHCTHHDDIVCLMQSATDGSDELLLVFAEDDANDEGTRQQTPAAVEPTYASIRKSSTKTRSDALNWLKSQDYAVPDDLIALCLTECSNNSSREQQKTASTEFTDEVRIQQDRAIVVSEEDENPYLLPHKDDSTPPPSFKPSSSDYDTVGDDSDIGYATLTRAVRDELERCKAEASRSKQNQTEVNSSKAGTTNLQSAGSEGIYDEICKFGTLTTNPATFPGSAGSVIVRRKEKELTSPLPQSSTNCPPPLPPARRSTVDQQNPPALVGCGRGTIQRLNNMNQAAVINILWRIEQNEAAMDACFSVLVERGLRTSGDWKRLARQLPICGKVERRIRAIEARYPKDERRQAMVALTDWRCYRGQRATVRALVAALRQCNLLNDVALIEQSIEESPA